MAAPPDGYGWRAPPVPSWPADPFPGWTERFRIVGRCDVGSRDWALNSEVRFLPSEIDEQKVSATPRKGVAITAASLTPNRHSALDAEISLAARSSLRSRCWIYAAQSAGGNLPAWRQEGDRDRLVACGLKERRGPIEERTEKVA